MIYNNSMMLEAGKLNTKKVKLQTKIKKFIKAEDVVVAKPSVISITPTVKTIKKQKKERKKKARRMGRQTSAFWQGLLTGTAVFTSIVLVVVLSIAFIVVPMVQNWLKGFGIPDFDSVINLLSDANVTVKEESTNANERMTTKSFTTNRITLYREAVLKFRESGLDLFEGLDGYNFDGDKLGALNSEIIFDDIYLTDKQFGAFILESYNSFIHFLDLGIINELNISFRLCELKLEVKDDNSFNINLVAEMIAPNLRNQSGVLSILLPEKMFIVVNMDAKNVENGNLEFSNAKIGLNKYSEKSFEALFDILVMLVRTNGNISENITLNEVLNFIVEALETGINAAGEHVGGKLNIVGSSVGGFDEPVFKISSN